MSECYIGEIRMVGFTFAPRGWANCDGQLLAISGNDLLFALIGTTYGGDGQTTFALPDLRSQAPIHRGTAPFGTYVIGQRGGTPDVTVDVNEMPSHTHQPAAHIGTGANLSAPGTNSSWSTSTTALYATAVPSRASTGATTGWMAPDALAPAGATQPHPNQPPYLGMRFVIALEGIFPIA